MQIFRCRQDKIMVFNPCTQMAIRFSIRSRKLHELQHETTRDNTSTTRDNTGQHEYNTTQHETKRVQHETTRYKITQHETTRVQHDTTRHNTSTKQHKINFNLFISLLHIITVC